MCERATHRTTHTNRNRICTDIEKLGARSSVCRRRRLMLDDSFMNLWHKSHSNEIRVFIFKLLSISLARARPNLSHEIVRVWFDLINAEKMARWFYNCANDSEQIHLCRVWDEMSSKTRQTMPNVWININQTIKRWLTGHAFAVFSIFCCNFFVAGVRPVVDSGSETRL